MKVALVTGASGFIGRHTVAPLLERGFEVHAVGRGNQPDVQWHAADLLNASDRRDLIAAVRPTHLLHLAWYVEHGKFWTALENLDWIHASADLFVQFAKHGGRRWVGAGTCAEYDWSGGGLLNEDAPLQPATLYGASKHALRILLQTLAHDFDISFAWGRVFLLYGPGEAPGRLVPSVIRSLLAGEPARCTDGLQQRDFFHVEDVAAAFAHLLDSEYSGAVNISSGAPVRVRAVVERIGEMTGRPDLVHLGALPSRAGEPDLLAGDASSLCASGFRARYTLDGGLRQTIEWWKRHNI
jgi:nucleoside-diphosphate-sugar epimerase